VSQDLQASGHEEDSEQGLESPYQTRGFPFGLELQCGSPQQSLFRSVEERSGGLYP